MPADNMIMPGGWLAWKVRQLKRLVPAAGGVNDKGHLPLWSACLTGARQAGQRNSGQVQRLVRPFSRSELILQIDLTA